MVEKRNEKMPEVENMFIRKEYVRALKNGGDVGAWVKRSDGVIDLGSPKPVIIQEAQSAMDIFLDMIKLAKE